MLINQTLQPEMLCEINAYQPDVTTRNAVPNQCLLTRHYNQKYCAKSMLINQTLQPEMLCQINAY